MNDFPNEPQVIELVHGSGVTPVIVQPGLLDTLGGWLMSFCRGERLLVVTDDNVWAGQGERFSRALIDAGLGFVPLILPPGEASKSWATLIELLDRCIEHGVERGDTIIAFGGGVIGDLTGFAAAILKRGCRYIQVPTTLLAQVDSSVGGKTAINTRAGKNLVGAFHQPTAVLADPLVLETLPGRHIRAGYAEIVKYGLIGDPDFFAWCETHGARLIAGDVEARVTAIGASVGAKAAIVGSDEQERSGQRALLNLGHSFGHALEAETGFSASLLHGEAVAIGMTLAFQLSAARGLCEPQVADRVATHLQACSLPTSLSSLALDCDARRLAEHMRHDKKNEGGRLKLILARGIGEAFVDDSVTFDELVTFLAARLPATEPLRAALR